MTHFRKNLVAAAVALAALPMTSYAAPITLTTSVGNITGITEFDWAPSPVIAIDGNTAFNNRIGGACSGLAGDPTLCDFDVYSQGRLAAFNVGASVPGGLNTTWEITYEIGFRERVISAASLDTDGDGTDDQNTASFAFRPGEPNYFRMYFHDTANSNYLAGTGFTDGTLILDGNVAPAQAFISNFTASIAPVTLDTNGDPILVLDPVIEDLDQTNNGDGWSGTQTVTGTGSTTPLNLLIAPVTLNPLFFVNTLVNSLTMDNLSQQLPFTTVDPSKSFNWDSTGSGLVGDRIVLNTPNQICAGGVEGPGCTNGLTGPSNIFQTDPNSPIDGRTIPEPGSLALLGIGLLGMAAGGRRVNPFSRRRNANA